MESITSVMKKEHDNIMLVLDAIERNAENLNNGEEFNSEFYEKFVDFQRHYTDRFHHVKEEEILFPILEKCPQAKEQSKVKVLVHQHILSRAHIDNIEAGLKDNNIMKIVSNSIDYAVMIREHILREDQDYFPFIESLLSKEEKTKILKEFIRSEQILPEGTYEKYINLAKEIRTLAGLQ